MTHPTRLPTEAGRVYPQPGRRITMHEPQDYADDRAEHNEFAEDRRRDEQVGVADEGPR